MYIYIYMYINIYVYIYICIYIYIFVYICIEIYMIFVYIYIYISYIHIYYICIYHVFSTDILLLVSWSMMWAGPRFGIDAEEVSTREMFRCRDRGSKHCIAEIWPLGQVPLPCHSVFDHGAGLREVQCCSALGLFKSNCFTSEVSIIKTIEAVWQGLKRFSLATHTIYHNFHLGNANVKGSLFSLFLQKSQKESATGVSGLPPPGGANPVNMHRSWENLRDHERLWDGRRNDRRKLCLCPLCRVPTAALWFETKCLGSSRVSIQIPDTVHSSSLVQWWLSKVLFKRNETFVQAFGLDSFGRYLGQQE